MGSDVGSSVGDNLLRISVTVQYFCSASPKKNPFVSPNIEAKNLQN